MKKTILILFILFAAGYSSAQNYFYIDDRYTITGPIDGSDTLSNDAIDTVSKFVGLNSLASRFSTGFQVSVYSPTDTLLMYIGTGADFDPGMTTMILPGVPFNTAYNKIRSGLNVFFKKRSPTAGTATYYPWIGGI